MPRTTLEIVSNMSDDEILNAIAFHRYHESLLVSELRDRSMNGKSSTSSDPGRTPENDQSEGGQVRD